MNLETVIISDGIENVGEMAFAYCGNLQNVEIPSSVTTMGDYVFAYSGDESTIIKVPFKEGELPEGWSENWLNGFDGTVEYLAD